MIALIRAVKVQQDDGEAKNRRIVDCYQLQLIVL